MFYNLQLETNITVGIVNSQLQPAGIFVYVTQDVWKRSLSISKRKK